MVEKKDRPDITVRTLASHWPFLVEVKITKDAPSVHSEEKARKYLHLASRLNIYPFIINSSGRCGAEAQRFVREKCSMVYKERLQLSILFQQMQAQVFSSYVSKLMQVYNSRIGGRRV
jgi:hypothetical protein